MKKVLLLVGITALIAGNGLRAGFMDTIMGGMQSFNSATNQMALASGTIAGSAAASAAQMKGNLLLAQQAAANTALTSMQQAQASALATANPSGPAGALDANGMPVPGAADALGANGVPVADAASKADAAADQQEEVEAQAGAEDDIAQAMAAVMQAMPQDDTDNSSAQPVS